MTLVTIQDYPVYNIYYYILDYEKLMQPKLLHFYFLNRVAAKRAIELNFPKKRKKFFKVIRGDKVKRFFIAYNMGKGLEYTKYQYGDWDLTKQDRKNHRTVMRRRLRRMGLLTLVDTKINIKRKPKVIKPINNTQKVSTSPTSIARVFTIQRKNPNYYYIIYTKKLANKKKYLWEIGGLRYNGITGRLKQTVIITRRTDFLTPYLLTDLKKLIDEKIQSGQPISYYEGFGYPKFTKGQENPDENI